MKLQRQHWVLLALFLIITGEVIHYIWAHWGLITVHSKTTPLAQVIRSIEKQGHVKIKTNIDTSKPVFMYVDNVSLHEAMETLATVMDARWRLTYVLGPDKGTVNGVLASFESGQRDEEWKHIYVPLPGFSDVEVSLAGPRKDKWTVTPASDGTLQAYLNEAARNVSASFWVQESWNPAVKSPPKAGPISSSLSKLASASKSQYAEVIVLQASNRDREERDRGDDSGRVAGNEGRRFDSSAMDERIQNEINKLSGEDRIAAQAERDRRKQIMESMKDLTPEQRAQRFQDLMNNPDVQAKMDDAKNAHDSRQSPQQRTARAQGYLSAKASAMSAAGK